MKILSIRIKNLASLAGEHFIDFESEPLASAGLIAIIGKTGAGKSTILDAMCLALFNRIPRLKDSDGKLVDVDGSELLSNSPLTVLRRGTAHGYAELCFVAQDQKTYLARWELKRSREKADGKLQSVQRYLKCLSDGVVIADKTKAVDTNIHKITQLSFEQFTRAVLLAQSEVTAFLKARDNERGELLEYLTDSAIFAKIGQLAFEKTKSIASKRKELENLIGHIELLTEEQVIDLTSQFEKAKIQYSALEAEKNQLEQQQRWFQRKQQLDTEILLKQQIVDAQLKTQQELVSQRELLQQLTVFSEIRSNVFQQQQLLKTEQQLTPQLAQQQQLFSQMTIQFEAEQKRFTQAELALNKQQKFEETHFNTLNEVRKCIQERDFLGSEFKKLQNKMNELEERNKPTLQALHEKQYNIEQTTQKQNELKKELIATQHFSRLDTGLNAHIQQLNHFIQQYQSLESQINTLSQAELQKQKLDLQQSIEQFGLIDQIETNLIQTRQQREQHIQRLNQLETLEQKLNYLFELQADAQHNQAQLNTLTEQYHQAEKDTQQTEKAYQTSKAEKLTIQHVLQQQKLLHTENIEHLRAELKDGEACLVCGSTTHPYRHNAELISKTLLDLQQQQEDTAIQKELADFQAWQQTQQKQTQLHAEIGQRQASLQITLSKVEANHKSVLEHALIAQVALNLAESQTNTLQQLHQTQQQLKIQIQELEEKINNLSENQKTQHNLQQRIQQTEHLLTTADNLKSQIQHITECFVESEQLKWQHQPLATAQHNLTRLIQRLEQLGQLEQFNTQINQITQQQQTLQLTLENTLKQITEIKQTQDEVKQSGIQNTETAIQLIQGMTGQNEIKPNEWLIEYEVSRQQTQKHYQEQRLSFEQQRNHFEQAKNQLEQIKIQLQQTQENLQQHNTEIKFWLEKHPHLQNHDLNHLLNITPSQEQEIRSVLQHADKVLAETNAALKTIQEQYSEHLQHQPNIDLSQLQQRITENSEAFTILQNQRDQLKLQLELHQQNINKQQQFANQISEIQLEEHRWSKISDLMGDKEGKKFRDYAQQYNLDILLEYANQQLAMLSQRYTLKRLDNSLSLAIIDHDMDGETRAVASLSGGESFLTALALSLAIANMASGHTKIESLFIDEGFGTLDASSLHMVMNALDQLQNQGRKVVLISHIQEMHERIPVQIQVRPVGAGASTIEVVG